MKNIKLILIILFIFINSLYSQKMYLLNGPTGIGGLKMMKDLSLPSAPNAEMKLTKFVRGTLWKEQKPGLRNTVQASMQNALKLL